MAEPTPYMRCPGCDGSTFRVPLEHKGYGYVLHCAKCGVMIDAPEQEYEPEHLQTCPAAEMKIKYGIDVCSG